jgi:N-acetylneuraminic acid mutarotase
MNRLLFAAAVWLVATAAHAHFPWLGSDGQDHPILWFGESPADRTYHMPDSLRGIELRTDANGDPLELDSIDTDELVGVRSRSKVERGEVFGSVVYGLYHGMKLTYHVEHLAGDDPVSWPTEPRERATLQTVITPQADGVRVRVLQNGKPVAGQEVKLFCEEGHEEAAKTTDGQGMVVFSGSEVESGLNAVMVGIKSDSVKGMLDGKPFTSSADYLTSTFYVASDAKSESMKKKTEPDTPKVEPGSNVRIETSGLPDLPEELTSFGAALAGDRLFVYGGHTGNAHSYSNEEQSDRLWCLDLSATDKPTWKTVATGPRLQGLALVPYGDQVIRIGGFTAKNDPGEEQDLHSLPLVARFDPQSGDWKELPPLPEGRSSFDAAVVGDRVFVFGGWEMSGNSNESQWHQTAYSLDLSDPEATWQTLAEPPFRRRAISVAAHDGKLFVVGGMRPEGKPTTRVDVYDIANDTWSTGPEIPGGGMSGFGTASFAQDGSLYVTAMDGFVHRLSDSGKRWNTVAKLEPARFFHRLVPFGEDRLLVLGGANMQVGKFTEVEQIRVERR